MAKITRKTQKIFGGNSSNNAQYGSARAGTFILDNDPDVIQALPAWESGINAATISGEKLPALEEAQGIYYVATRQVAYVLQEGIPEYDPTTTYYENSIVKESGTVKIYKSLGDDNVGNPLEGGSDPAWELVIDLDNVPVLPQNNYIATTDPTSSDDNTQGYSQGSKWYNTVSGEAYLCVDASTGAAVWVLVSLTVDDLGDLAFEDIAPISKGGTGSTTASEARTALDVYSTTEVDDLIDDNVIGVDDTWTDVTGSRALGTTYTNTTGKPIQVAVTVNSITSSTGDFRIGGTTVATSNTGSNTSMRNHYQFIIPDGATYEARATGGTVTLINWWELS